MYLLHFLNYIHPDLSVDLIPAQGCCTGILLHPRVINTEADSLQIRACIFLGSMFSQSIRSTFPSSC